MPSDDLEAKLARLSAHVADRGAETRAELGRIGFLEVAELLRTTFHGKLIYLRTERIDIGRDIPRGQPYNFELKGHANGAAAIERHTSAPRRKTSRPRKQGPIPESLRDRAAGND